MIRNCLFGQVCACSAPRLSQYLIPVYQEPGFATVQARMHANVRTESYRYKLGTKGADASGGLCITAALL